MGVRKSRRLGIAAVAAVAVAAALPAPAGASITLGQTADPSSSSCGANLDFFQISALSGASYVVPSTGTITSWTMFGAGPAGQQLTMKVYRKVAEPSTYQVVGHAGPQTLTPGGTAGNTFPASIPVKAGDFIGLHSLAINTKCAVVSSGNVLAAAVGDLGDGATDTFNTSSVGFLDISASFNPDNGFALAGSQRNKKRGTALLTINLPNAGTLSATGRGAKVGLSTSVPAGVTSLTVKSKGKSRKALNANGKVKLTLSVTYTPTGGDPNTQAFKVKLLKK